PASAAPFVLRFGWNLCGNHSSSGWQSYRRPKEPKEDFSLILLQQWSLHPFAGGLIPGSQHPVRASERRKAISSAALVGVRLRTVVSQGLRGPETSELSQAQVRRQP